MRPHAVSKPGSSPVSGTGPLGVWWELTRSQRTLCLLAGLWLFSGLDLCMSISAWRNGLLDSVTECNPFAALMIPFGPWALLAYKLVLTVAGSLTLVIYRRRRIAELTSAAVLIVYALVAFEWKLFYGICARSREVSLGVGEFCDSADRIGYVTLGCAVTLLGLWGAFTRRGGEPTAVLIRTTRSRAPVKLRWVAVTATGTCLLPLCCSPARSEWQHAREALHGTIYFRDCLDPNGPLWRMNADGSDKTALPPGVRGEPSGQLHGDCRWFLDARGIPGATYPDGGQRRELFAVRSDGLSVQLTEQSDLEPSPFAARWPVHAADRMISWVARRWDHTGQVIEGGIYAGTVIFSDDGQVLGLVEQPRDPLVRLELVDIYDSHTWWRTSVPAIYDHHWSPDGAAIVYESTRSELFIADLRARRTTCLTTGPAIDPAWSPDGMQIAFKISNGAGAIATIRPDGTDTRIISRGRSGRIVGVARPVWSPAGGHVLYQRIGFPRAVELPADVDLLLAPADGDFSANLTADVYTALIPIAWR
ncbi:MAG: PD40 domain-containing protein [Phycisphaerales bacterium]|nr:MAG: PD40 domain-containing protein [Phycisphaerales bacterium]